MRPGLSVIIPTRNRPEELRRLLVSLQGQSVLPDEIVIVDASTLAAGDDRLAADFSGLNIKIVRTDKPGLTRQRNLGLTFLDASTGFVCFLDDDLVFCEGAMAAMMTFWQTASPRVGGAAFNIINEREPGRLAFLKKIFLTGDSRRGVVLPSGYNTLFCPARQTGYVQWMLGGATVWRRQLFEKYRFDEWYEGTGLCEDLDFSYRVAKKYQLAVVSGARVEHITDRAGRRDNRQFGITEICNRYYFVMKHAEFSRVLFLWAGFGQFLENVFRGIFLFKKEYLARAVGNIIGFARLGHTRKNSSCKV